MYHNVTWTGCFVQADGIVESGVSWQDVLVSFAVCLFPEPHLCLQGCCGLCAAQHGLLKLAGPLTAPQTQDFATRSLSLISPH